MKQSMTPRPARTRRERIREIGFDPDFLTDREQAELLDLHLALEAARPPERLEPIQG